VSWRGRRHQRTDWAFFVSIIAGYHVAAYSDNMFYYLVVNWEFWFLCGSYLVWLARPHAQRAESPVEGVEAPTGEETPPRRPTHAPAYRGSLRPTTPRRR
jgi:hypothetical protein